MKHILFLSLGIEVLSAQQQFQKYIPKGYTLEQSIESDYNKDQRKDALLVLAPASEEQPRALLLLEQQSNATYKKVIFNPNAFLCKACGGMKGDPLNDLTFDKNVIKWSYYGGSNWVWTQNYTFRFQKQNWQLIGFSSEHFKTNEECGDEGIGFYDLKALDVNISTGKAHSIKRKECTIQVDQWLKIKQKPSIGLSTFNEEQDYSSYFGLERLND